MISHSLILTNNNKYQFFLVFERFFSFRRESLPQLVQFFWPITSSLPRPKHPPSPQPSTPPPPLIHGISLASKSLSRHTSPRDTDLLEWRFVFLGLWALLQFLCCFLNLFSFSDPSLLPCPALNTLQSLSSWPPHPMDTRDTDLLEWRFVFPDLWELLLFLQRVFFSTRSVSLSSLSPDSAPQIQSVFAERLFKSGYKNSIHVQLAFLVQI